MVSRFKKKHAEHRSDGGTAALEFAILLPLLLLVLFGIIDWGYVFFVDLSLTNAAREGARTGVTKTLDAQPGPEAAAKQKAEDYLKSVGLGNRGTVAVSFDNEKVTVTTTVAPFRPLVGFLPDSALPDSLSATAVMRWEMEGVSESP